MVCNGPFILKKNYKNGAEIPKPSSEWSELD